MALPAPPGCTPCLQPLHIASTPCAVRMWTVFDNSAFQARWTGRDVNQVCKNRRMCSAFQGRWTGRNVKQVCKNGRMSSAFQGRWTGRDVNQVCKNRRMCSAFQGRWTGRNVKQVCKNGRMSSAFQGRWTGRDVKQACENGRMSSTFQGRWRGRHSAAPASPGSARRLRRKGRRHPLWTVRTDSLLPCPSASPLGARCPLHRNAGRAARQTRGTFLPGVGSNLPLLAMFETLLPVQSAGVFFVAKVVTPPAVSLLPNPWQSRVLVNSGRRAASAGAGATGEPRRIAVAPKTAPSSERGFQRTPHAPRQAGPKWQAALRGRSCSVWRIPAHGLPPFCCIARASGLPNIPKKAYIGGKGVVL